LSALRLLIFLVVAFVPAAVGRLFGPGSWYASIAKPAWTPPGWVFGPVWTVLYALIGIAGWLAWEASAGKPRLLPFAVFAAQLVLNGLWSWLFFGLRRPDLALVDIVLMLALIGANLALFARLRGVAGALLVPYLLWVAFATALNAAIWRLNA
jgi:tryptophan-rich sensory protein